MELEKQLAFDFDLATLDLKGRRFREAAGKFQNLVRASQKSEAWVGLAAAKFGLLLEDVTVAEVFFCFDKAREADHIPADLDTVVKGLSETTIIQLSNLYISAVKAERAAQKQLVQSAIISGFSVMASMGSANEGKNVNSILWAANASINFSDYIKANTSVQQLKGLQEHARKPIEEIKQQVLLFLHDKPDMIASFESTNKRLQAEMADATLTDRDRKQIADNTRERELTQQRKKYVEANQHIIEDKDSPYHTLKRDGIKLYEAWRFKKALINIDKALEIYKGEELLLQTRKQARAAILTAGILIDIAISSLVSM